MRKKSPFDAEFASELAADEIGPHSTPHKSRFKSYAPKPGKGEGVNVEDIRRKKEHMRENAN